MIIDKNYFLARLANGEDIDTIGESIADMMNAAVAEHNAQIEAEKAKAAELEKERYKREIAEDFIHLMQEYAELTCPEAVDMLSEYDDEDVDEMINAIDQMFGLLKMTMQLKASLETAKPATKQNNHVFAKSKSDDEVLTNFIASLM